MQTRQVMTISRSSPPAASSHRPDVIQNSPLAVRPPPLTLPANAGEGESEEAVALLAEQREDVLRHRVRLRQNRRTSLLQNLRAGQVRRFSSEVGVLDAATSSRQVLTGRFEVR